MGSIFSLPVIDGIVTVVINVKNRWETLLNSVCYPGRSIIYNVNKPCSGHSKNQQADNSPNKVEVFCEKLKTIPYLKDNWRAHSSNRWSPDSKLVTKTQDLKKLDQYPLHVQGKILSSILNSIPCFYLLKEKDSICFSISHF